MSRLLTQHSTIEGDDLVILSWLDGLYNASALGLDDVLFLSGFDDVKLSQQPQCSATMTSR